MISTSPILGGEGEVERDRIRAGVGVGVEGAEGEVDEQAITVSVETSKRKYLRADIGNSPQGLV
jgi:hypothetical protein